MSTPRRTSTLSAVRAASAPHRTATSDASWDGTANGANCPADRTRLRAAFAHVDPDGDPDTAAAYSLLHHFVDAEGAVGAASTVACLAAIAALNDSGDSAEREAEWKHLRKHLVDSGLDPADVPPLEAAVEPETLAALHDPMECMHSHDHSTMADGGGTHAHEHQHAGDANHDHPHDPSMMNTEPVTASAHTVDAMVASLSATGSSWGILQDGNDWIVVGRDGEAARFVAESPDADHLRRAANLALARLGELAFADGQAVSSAGRFRAEIIPEGVETSDGRTIEPGATRWSRLDSQGTLPVMLQTVTEVGHFGAVLAGRMDAAERAGDVVVASGDFDDSEAGHEFADIVEARGRFGVSVDLIEMEAEFECTQMEDGWCEDGLLRVTSCELGGFCYDEETEILTETRGWVGFDDLLPADRVASRDNKTSRFEWATPTYHHAVEWDGPMIRFKSNNIDLLVTPNHRMLVVNNRTNEIEVIRAEKLAIAPRTRYRIPLTSAWDADDVRTFRIESAPIPDGECACGCGEQAGVRGGDPCTVDGCDHPSSGRGFCNVHYQRWYRYGDPLAGGPPEANRSENSRYGAPRVTLPGHGHGSMTEPAVYDGDDFAAFMGMYLAEGSVQRNDRGKDAGFVIAQMPKSKGYGIYADLLGRMFSSVTATETKFIIKDARLARYLRPLGKAWEKHVPEEIKAFSARQLRIFLDFYLAGDGCEADGRWRASTTSPRLAGDLQEIAQKCGMWATAIERPAPVDVVIEGRHIPAANQHQSYAIGFRNWPGKARSEFAWTWTTEQVERYTGMVRCVSVPNETLYVRRNGRPVWCMNTGTPFPAFADAFIELEASAASNAQAASAHRPAARPCRDCGAEQAIVASIPVSPPSGWFAPPELQGPTAMTVTEDGAVFGHAFLWGSCHIGHADVCVTPPRSASGYRSFLVGEVRCADGSTVAIGHLTLGTGHASLSADPRSAAAHYDDTGTVIADVTCGEDAYGGWFAGALRPHVDAEQVRALRASAVSGDWRRIGGTLELVAMLAVNVPGFPVPRARVAGGAQLALVAAGAGPLAVEPDPYADALAALEERLTARIARVETVARPLRALAAQAIVASVTPATEPVPESASA